jgi:hypothetical protein
MQKYAFTCFIWLSTYFLHKEIRRCWNKGWDREREGGSDKRTYRGRDWRNNVGRDRGKDNREGQREREWAALEFEYLYEYETEYENNWGYESEVPVELIHEQSRAKKSRATLPLNYYELFYHRYLVIYFLTRHLYTVERWLSLRKLVHKLAQHMHIVFMCMLSICTHILTVHMLVHAVINVSLA